MQEALGAAKGYIYYRYTYLSIDLHACTDQAIDIFQNAK